MRFRNRFHPMAVSDSTIVAVAVAEVVGARWAAAIPLGVMLVVAVVALAWRHPVVLVLAGLVVASSLAARSWAGLVSVGSHAVNDEVTLVSDPVRTMGAVRAEVRLDGYRYDAWARGRTGAALEARSAGEHVVITGRTSSVTLNSWRASRHLRGRIVVDEVVSWSPGNLMSRATNGLRGTLMRGSRHLPDDLQPLFGGFVLGDTRGQSPLMADDFRRSGLTHLLVVSGSNVAFVLVVVSPLLTRLGLRKRLVVTLAVLVFFAFLTRMEPSVLRATVMAGLAASASMFGRPQTSVRLLASAVVVLLLIDPLLVNSFGFALSVAACVGIVFLARPIAEALPGPRRLAQALGVTIGAQLGVSPVLLQLTRAVPVATLPANLLAEPVAGFIMGWGMTVGVIAGIVPGWLASVLHTPTAVGLWWINSVARWSASAPLGHLGTAGLMALGIGTPVVIAMRRKGRSGSAVVATIVVLAITVAVPGGGVSRTHGSTDLAVGAVLWSAPDADGVWGQVLVVDGRADTGRVLSALHESDVDRIDLLVVASASRAVTSVVAMVPERIDVTSIWVADEVQAVSLVGGVASDVVVVNTGDSTSVGGVVVEVRTVTPKLGVDISVPGVGSPDAATPDEVGARISGP